MNHSAQWYTLQKLRAAQLQCSVNDMKRKIVTAVVAAAICGCVNARAEDSVPATTAVTNVFSLACVLAGSEVHCAVRNVTTNAVKYSSYTIGYHETVVLERYDVHSRSWARVPWRGACLRFYKSAGASLGDVKTVAPGGLVPPERREAGMEGVSFVVQLQDYELSLDEVQILRVTQIMGSMLGSDLPVWKGWVVSEQMEYRPNKQLQPIAGKPGSG